MEPHLLCVKLEFLIHGVLFCHETPMSDVNNFRVALNKGLLKASGQMLNLRLLSGLNASFVVVLEQLQLISLHDDADIRRSSGI